MMPKVLATSLLALLLASPLVARAQSGAAPPPDAKSGPSTSADTAAKPLSAAQIALFETPHLQNVDHPETLIYRFVRQGPDGFADQIGEAIKLIHPDGGKYVMFNFLTGAHHVYYPALDGFHGNPLVMVFLEHDVDEMRDETGIAASYYRNRIRDAFIDKASVAPVSVTVDGRSVAAQEITLRPFVDNERLTHLPQIQGKTYRFVLSTETPGGIVEVASQEAAAPASAAPPLSETVTFDKVEQMPPATPAKGAAP